MAQYGRQGPIMGLVQGGGDKHAVATGRRDAALAIVAGYEAAVTALDPSDHEELAWYRARLLDARLGADHVCAAHPFHAFGSPLG